LPDHTFRDRKFKKWARAELPNMVAAIGTEPLAASVPITLHGDLIGAVDVNRVRASAAAILASTRGSELQIEIAARTIAEKVRRGTIDAVLAELIQDQRFFLEQASRSQTHNGFHISQLIDWLEAQTGLDILKTDRGLFALRLILTEPANPAVQRRALCRATVILTPSRH
jgi:hypothetical protein